MSHRLRHLSRQFLTRAALTGVERELHPVELVEHVVRKVERAVREDVALNAAQDTKRRDELIRRRDFLALSPQVVRV
jgi:hypothetical protein